ncbi:MAG: hypothetical protein QXW41_07660 [Fervidicoccaceae archaeon]
MKVITSFRIKPVYLEEGNTRLGNWTLRRFQEEVRDSIASGKDAVVSAVTGGGKTVSLLLGDQGFVGLYPNNTLLLDQQRSLDRILRLALNARLVYSHKRGYEDVLRIYEIDTQPEEELQITRCRRVAVILLSGRYIGYEYDEDGRLVPKRVVILRDIVEKLQSKSDIYVVTLGTPDTALMIMAGIYRSFEKVGYAIHNAILESVEGGEIGWMLSKYGVATVGELGDLAIIREYLLKYPWFIDEFHLYGDYEASLLLPVLKVFREQVGWDYPVIFSSATPSGSLYKKAVEYLKPREIKAKLSEKGSPDSFVRGETEVEVVAVSSKGKGIAKWLNAGFEVPTVVGGEIDEVKKVVENGGNVFIVVDRVNQVPPIVDVLVAHGVKPECSVSVKPRNCSDREEPVVVGSESVSQGIDRANVRLGIISTYNAVALIQRFGRIGRKTDSKVILVVPELREELPIEALNGKGVSYDEFVEAVEKTYSDVMFSELMKTKKIREIYEKRSRLVEIATTIGYAQVSKPKQTLEELSKILREDVGLLDMFYGPAEVIAKTLMFRGSGFPVVVEKPGGEREIADVSVVLRNFAVEKSWVKKVRVGDIEKKMLVLRIGFEPGRNILAMEPEVMSKVRVAFAQRFNGTVTTVGELANLGYSLNIKSVDEEGKETSVFTLSSRELLGCPT